jgi:hypothetical protein
MQVLIVHSTTCQERTELNKYTKIPLSVLQYSGQDKINIINDNQRKEGNQSR